MRTVSPEASVTTTASWPDVNPTCYADASAMARARSRLRFLATLLLEHRYSYLGGVLAVAATLIMTLAVPRYLERALNAQWKKV